MTRIADMLDNETYTTAFAYAARQTGNTEIAYHYADWYLGRYGDGLEVHPHHAFGAWLIDGGI